MKKIAFLLISQILTLSLFAQPVINSFSPNVGAPGTMVTIVGTGFSTTPANNIVYFGAIKTNVLSATNSTLLVAAPGGATYQPVTVSVNNLTAYSANPFIMTFAGDAGPFTSTSFLPKVDLTAGIYPHSISVADFNNDGKNDLLVCKSSSGTVTVFTNNSTSGNISFTTKIDIAAPGNNHECSATGDLDGDGKQDFVITNTFGYNSVSVYRNTSTGSSISFATNIDIAADNAPYSVAIGDLDGDGKPDIAIANNGSFLINVYRNTSTPGNISFASRIDYTVGTYPYSVAINDLDGDGKAELAVTTQGGSSALFVLKNTSAAGTISFNTPINVATFGAPFVVSIGDLDGDGMPDLAAASGGNSIIAVRNTSTSGNLSFAPQQSFATGGYSVCVAINDLNGDGKPDMASVNRIPVNSVSVLRNTSTPGNISFDSSVDYPVNMDPFFVAAGDFDGDGRPDIAAANSSDATVSILRNISGANIAPSISSFTPASGINGTVIKIAGSNFTGATSVKFGGTEAASFIVDSATGITAIAGPGASGDVNVTTANGTATLAGFIFNGPIINSFSPSIGIAGTVITITGSNFTGASSVKFGGIPASSFIINSSTTITAIAGPGASGDVSVTTSNGTATLAGFSYGPPTITSFTPASAKVGTVITITGTNFSPIATNNIVFFGAVKAIVSSATATELNVIVPAGSIYQPITVTTNNLTAYSSMLFAPTFSGDGNGISINSFSAKKDFGTGQYPFSVSISDLNDDRKPDLLVVNGVGNSISILSNTSIPGSVSFNSKTDFSTGPDPRRVAIGDLNGDGKPDVVVTNFNSGNASSISIFRNTSTGGTISFASKVDYNTGNGSVGLSIADMDGDGKPDILVTSGNSGFFSFIKNTSSVVGTIAFGPKQDFTLPSHPDNLIVADLDKDGYPDIITSNFSGGNISVFRNTSNGGNFSLASPSTYTTDTNPTYLSAVDADGDGRLDLAVTNFTSGTISIFMNNSTSGNISLLANPDYTLKATNISMADLDGDGKTDLFTGQPLTGISSVLPNQSSGAGNINFSANVNFTTGNFDSYTASGDLDGDTKPDLIVINTIPNTVSILRNKISDPVITSISDTTGVKGETIIITGGDFTGATSVMFGGVAAESFTIVSPARIDAVVPGGASGDLKIYTPLGIASMQGFNFIPEVSTTDPSNFCKDQFVELNSTASTNNQWYKNGTVINGATEGTLRTNSSGEYTVKATSNGITTSSTNSITLTVIIIPAPEISKNADNDLLSSVETGNQWYLNGNIIPGATDKIYHPDQNGSYSVKSIIDGCSSDLSAPYQVAFSGVINLGNDKYIALYPNPVKDELTINWNFNDVSVLNISISDLSGNQVIKSEDVHKGATINLLKLPPGIYLVRIYTNDQFRINKSTKIIKAG